MRLRRWGARVARLVVDGGIVFMVLALCEVLYRSCSVCRGGGPGTLAGFAAFLLDFTRELPFKFVVCSYAYAQLGGSFGRRSRGGLRPVPGHLAMVALLLVTFVWYAFGGRVECPFDWEFGSMGLPGLRLFLGVLSVLMFLAEGLMILALLLRVHRRLVGEEGRP